MIHIVEMFAPFNPANPRASYYPVLHVTCGTRAEAEAYAARVMTNQPRWNVYVHSVRRDHRLATR